MKIKRYFFLMCMMLVTLTACSKLQKNVEPPIDVTSQLPIAKMDTSLRPLLEEPRGAATNEGFYHIEETESGSFLSYIDFSSKTQVPLCASPNCPHQDNTCTAFLSSMNGTAAVAEWNGKLYLIYLSQNGEGPGSVVEMNLDGSSRRTIHSFKSNDVFFLSNQLEDNDALYLNCFTVEETDRGELHNTPHTYVYHQGDKGAVETTAILQPGDTVLTTVNGKVLVSRGSVNVTELGNGVNGFVDENGTFTQWESPYSDDWIQCGFFDGCAYLLNKITYELIRYDMSSEEEFSYGNLPDDMNSYMLCTARDGNAILSGSTSDGKYVYCLATDTGIRQSQFSYYAHETLRSGLLDADVGEDCYLIESKIGNPHNVFQIIPKKDYWNDLDTGKEVSLEW